MAGRNHNCLDGMRCPECGQRGRFSIEVMKYIEFSDDGETMEDPGGDNEWDGPSGCRCPCGHADSIQAFKDYRTDKQFAAGIPPITEEPEDDGEEDEEEAEEEGDE